MKQSYLEGIDRARAEDVKFKRLAEFKKSIALPVRCVGFPSYTLVDANNEPVMEFFGMAARQTSYVKMGLFGEQEYIRIGEAFGQWMCELLNKEIADL